MSVRVLLIDDDQSMCEMMASALQGRGYDVTWRTRGSDALGLVSEQDFDAVVTDLNLEKMSGLDICSHITENRPDVPVIVITAFGDMKSAIAAMRAGAYDFLNKPIEMEALGHTIERAIRHRKLQEEVKLLTDR